MFKKTILKIFVNIIVLILVICSSNSIAWASFDINDDEILKNSDYNIIHSIHAGSLMYNIMDFYDNFILWFAKNDLNKVRDILTNSLKRFYDYQIYYSRVDELDFDNVNKLFRLTIKDLNKINHYLDTISDKDSIDDNIFILHNSLEYLYITEKIPIQNDDKNVIINELYNIVGKSLAAVEDYERIDNILAKYSLDNNQYFKIKLLYNIRHYLSKSLFNDLYNKNLNIIVDDLKILNLTDNSSQDLYNTIKGKTNIDNIYLLNILFDILNKYKDEINNDKQEKIQYVIDYLLVNIDFSNLDYSQLRRYFSYNSLANLKFLYQIAPYADDHNIELINNAKGLVLNDLWNNLLNYYGEKGKFYDILDFRFNISELLIWHDLKDYVEKDSINVYNEWYAHYLSAFNENAQNYLKLTNEDERNRGFNNITNLNPEIVSYTMNNTHIFHNIELKGFFINYQINTIADYLFKNKEKLIVEYIEMNIFNSEEFWQETIIRVSFLNRKLREKKIKLDTNYQNIFNKIDQYDKNRLRGIKSNNVDNEE